MVFESRLRYRESKSSPFLDEMAWKESWDDASNPHHLAQVDSRASTTWSLGSFAVRSLIPGWKSPLKSNLPSSSRHFLHRHIVRYQLFFPPCYISPSLAKESHCHPQLNPWTAGRHQSFASFLPWHAVFLPQPPGLGDLLLSGVSKG